MIKVKMRKNTRFYEEIPRGKPVSIFDYCTYEGSVAPMERDLTAGEADRWRDSGNTYLKVSPISYMMVHHSILKNKKTFELMQATYFNTNKHSILKREISNSI